MTDEPIDTTRKVMPSELVGDDMVGVAPMTGPKGYAWYLYNPHGPFTMPLDEFKKLVDEVGHSKSEWLGTSEGIQRQIDAMKKTYPDEKSYMIFLAWNNVTKAIPDIKNIVYEPDTNQITF